MSTQRRGLRSIGPKERPPVEKFPARRFPIQHEIQKLEEELNAFNDRIAELEDEGHRGHAMDVLKANAIDFARQIDELRSLLVEPTKRGRSP
jgi:tRNA(Ser,Leu) C12 N-acetylase TAN1